MLSVNTFHNSNFPIILLMFVGASANINEKTNSKVLNASFYNKNINDMSITAITSIEEDFSRLKFDKIFASDPYLYDSLEFDSDKNKSNMTSFKKISLGDAKSDKGIECLWCTASPGSYGDENCYDAKIWATLRCAENEICFTELHPQFIKRGCVLPSKINRTFACNCPLCNDKPSNNPVYYQYKKLGDWDYHNKRIQIPMANMNLICKVCETRGINQFADRTCRMGKNADYMVCGRHQVCFVNIDEIMDSVSRGCTDTPAYNSMYYFCEKSFCNSKPFYVPKMQPEQLLLNEQLSRSLSNIKYSNLLINFVNLIVFLITC